jgi:hypothetical protein
MSRETREEDGKDGGGVGGADEEEGQPARATFGPPIPVPASRGEMEVAIFALTSPLRARAEAVLLKPPLLHLTTCAQDMPKPTTHCFMSGIAGNANVVAVPARLGYSHQFAPPTVLQLQLTGGCWTLGRRASRVTFLQCR